MLTALVHYLDHLLLFIFILIIYNYAQSILLPRKFSHLSSVVCFAGVIVADF